MSTPAFPGARPRLVPGARQGTWGVTGDLGRVRGPEVSQGTWGEMGTWGETQEVG